MADNLPIHVPEQPFKVAGLKVQPTLVAGAYTEGQIVIAINLVMPERPEDGEGTFYMSIKDALYVRDSITQIIEWLATNPANLSTKH